ncbi:MAG: HPF/RaiA family ribosome-associated protein [Acidimicrobiales bacterium]|nr:HPF/RaiA family ribosome-associated protein [Acidimicrobiales bacterium]
MPIAEDASFQVSTKGQVSRQVLERAEERLHRVADHCREPITKVDLRITEEKPLRGEPRVRAEATFEVTHGPVRAREHATTVEEAVDGMIERLRRRVDQHESRLHRIGKQRHDGVATEGSWHHGDVAATPRHPVPVPDGSATVIRRKSFAPAPMSVDEAAFDLDILDHDFYLFQEISSDETALISRAGDGRFNLQIPADAELSLDQEAPVDRSDGPVVLDIASAQRLLDENLDPFVFHRTEAGRPGQVLYRRFDGGYGVIELGS